MRILLFSDFSLPDSCANATRVINFAKILHALGHQIKLLGVSYAQNAPLSGEYDGIAYKMLQAKPYTGIRAGKRISCLSKDIGAFLEENAPYEVILLSNIYYDHARVFQKYAKEHGAHLIVNAVEWYDKNNPSFAGITKKINLIKNRIALRCIHRKMGNILAISSLLDDYYHKRGCNTVTIPTIIDLAEYQDLLPAKKDDTKIRIAYAGSPGKKDYILNALYALEYLNEDELERIEYHFYGPKKENLLSLGITSDFLARYEKNIVCHGRIPYEEVKYRIAEADFTILLRPQRRYANAGFPTKVGESMACGTPVIANLTSDIGKYLHDGENGVVCENETPKACAVALKKALLLTDEEKTNMRAKAFSTAEIGFNYLAHAESLQIFLNHCI